LLPGIFTLAFLLLFFTLDVELAVGGELWGHPVDLRVSVTLLLSLLYSEVLSVERLRPLVTGLED
jgi:hypothetical protein